MNKAKATDALLPHAQSGYDVTFTVDEAIEKVGMGRFQYIVLALAGLCWISDSMEMLLLSFIKSPTQCDFNISDIQAALVTTSVGVGMLFGNILWGLLADAHGRRLAFIAAAVSTLTCGLLSAASPSYTALVVFRGLTGIGIGGVPIAFSLVMEFLPMQSRGRWGMGLALFWSLGAIFEAALATVVMPHLGWRYLIAFSSTPLALLLVLSPILPESPRWLAAQGHITDAHAVLRRAAITNNTELPPGILISPPSVNVEKSPISALLRPAVRSLSFKLWLVWFFAAFTYFGSVVLQPDVLAAESAGRRCSYANTMCASLSTAPTCNAQSICGWDASTCVPAKLLKSRIQIHTPVNPACQVKLAREDYLSALWSTTGELPGTLATLLFVDIIGRRALLVYLYGIGSISFTLLATCPGKAAETALFFVARAVSNGYFQAIYLYTNEIFPASVRASAMGVSSAVARFGLILTPLVGQSLDNVNFALAIAIYAGSCVLAALAVFSIPIETTRRPLLESVEQLQALLAGKIEDDPAFSKFSEDTNVHPVVSALRLPARFDGRGSRFVREGF